MDYKKNRRLTPHYMTPNTNSNEDYTDKFLSTPVMERLLAAEGLLMATGRLSEFRGKTIQDELDDVLALKDQAHKAEVERAVNEERRRILSQIDGLRSVHGHNAKCNYATPKALDANYYNCSDIHLGYEEACADISLAVTPLPESDKTE